MNAIWRRLLEPSTWAGLAAFMAGLGIFGWTESQWLEVFSVLAMIGGSVGALLPEGSRE